MIKASVITLGCRVNQYESDAIMQELTRYGVQICQDDEICDIYIILMGVTFYCRYRQGKWKQMNVIGN